MQFYNNPTDAIEYQVTFRFNIIPLLNFIIAKEASKFLSQIEFYYNFKHICSYITTMIQHGLLELSSKTADRKCVKNPLRRTIYQERKQSAKNTVYTQKTNGCHYG